MTRSIIRVLIGMWAVLSLTVQAAVVFQDLGTNAPPSSLGGIAVVAFSQSAQAALSDGTLVTTIPGSPYGTLTMDLQIRKATVPSTWNGWSHGYTGPVYDTVELATPAARVLTLPAGATAFYFYANQNSYDVSHTITATSSSGTTSGPITIPALVGTANGYGFYATAAGESISSISVTTDDTSGFGIGEFGVGFPVFVTPALDDWGMLALAALCLLSGLVAVRRRLI